MRKLPALLAVAAAVAFVPAGALAAKPKPKAKKPSPRANVYKATLAPVGADAAYIDQEASAGRSSSTARRTTRSRSTFRGLTPGGTYLWHVHQATGAGDPCTDPAIAGPPYAGWDWSKVDPFTANAAGNYNKTLQDEDVPRRRSPRATPASSTTSTSTSPTAP